MFIVSTPVSELIGATWTTEHKDVKGSPLFFDSHSLDDDEWKSRDRALLFLWENRDHFVRPAGEAPPAARTRPSVNIIGPTYGCFNSYSDLAEIKRLIEGIGADVNLCYPFEAHSYDTPHLADAQANVVHLPRVRPVAGARDRPADLLRADRARTDHDFSCESSATRSVLRCKRDAFINREKRTTLAAWHDIWRSTHSDFFANAPIAVIAPPTYKDGLEHYLGEELGLPIAYSAYRTGAESSPNEVVREALSTASPSPMLIFGSINERMIIAQEKLPSLLSAVLVSGSRRAPRDGDAVRRLCGRRVAAAVRLRIALRRALCESADLRSRRPSRRRCRRAS